MKESREIIFFPHLYLSYVWFSFKKLCGIITVGSCRRKVTVFQMEQRNFQGG